jgi:hypothetical protein
MDDENELSPVEKMVLRARKIGPQGEQEPPRLKMVSFRLPYSLLASIDAFASITSESRNTTMINLLEAGVFAVANELDDDEQYVMVREHFIEKYSDIEE